MTIEVACASCGGLFRTDRAAAKYCSRRCCAAHQKKPFIVKKGYRKILAASHPRADAKGYVFEHIVVAESMLGRRIVRGEEIHHRNGNRGDNTESNLIVCRSHAEHMRLHARPS